MAALRGSCSTHQRWPARSGQWPARAHRCRTSWKLAARQRPRSCRSGPWPSRAHQRPMPSRLSARQRPGSWASPVRCQRSLEGSSFRAVCRWRCSSVVSAFCREGGRGPACWRHPGTAAPRLVGDSKSQGSSFRALSPGRAGHTEARRLRGFRHGSAPGAAALARNGQPAPGSGQRRLTGAGRVRSPLHSGAPEAAALSQDRAGLADAWRPRGFPHSSAPTAGPRRIVDSESRGSSCRAVCR